MNVEFLKDGTNFWACVRNSCTVTIQMKPLLLDWWKKSCSVMISEIKLFGGTFFSQHFYNNIYQWDLEISISTSGVKVHYSFSVCVVNYMSTKKNIKNTTCIKTVIFASCGTFIGNSVPSSSFIMHFLLTCITIIKTTVLIACMLIINIDVYVDVTVLVKNCPLQVSILDSCVNGESRTSYWELHCGLSLTRLDKTQQIHPWLISQ